MQPMRNTLSENIQAQSVELPNKRLAAAIDLHTQLKQAPQLKQAHWNLHAPAVIAIHAPFDNVSTEVEIYSDAIAEPAHGIDQQLWLVESHSAGR